MSAFLYLLSRTINPCHSCNSETSGVDAANHFRGVTKMIEIGKGGQGLSIWNLKKAVTNGRRID